MGEIKSIFELLGRFIPFFASFVWMFLLTVSLSDSKTRQEQQLRWLSLLFFTLFALGCLHPIVNAYFPSISLDVLMPIVIIWLPVIGYRLVWYMTDTGKDGDFRYQRHHILPLAYLLFLIVGEILVGGEPVSDYLYLIIILLFALCYLLLSLFRIRRYWSVLETRIKKSKNAIQWHRFVTKVALVTTLSPVLILIPQTTTFLFVIYLTLMFTFIGISSHLCYCSVFMNYAQSMPTHATLTTQPIEPEVEQPKRLNRRIAKISKNANGRMEMKPLTRKRFEEYMKKRKPYLNVNFKMTDLEEALSANRTVISNFVNRTYKMNFNRYINHLRINEVERLKKLPSSERYTLTELVRKAGFSSTRNYTRAIDIENEGISNKEQPL